jgi:hypothetical protein
MGITLSPHAFWPVLGLLCGPDLTSMLELICQQLPWALPSGDHDLGSAALELLCAVWCARPWRRRPLLAWNVVQLPHLCLMHASVSARAVKQSFWSIFSVLCVVPVFLQTTEFWKRVVIPGFETNSAKGSSPVGFPYFYSVIWRRQPVSEMFHFWKLGCGQCPNYHHHFGDTRCGLQIFLGWGASVFRKKKVEGGEIS